MQSMSRDDLGRLALSIVLTATAGYVDAIGFLKIGHLFVSFMSGDSTQLAVAASHSDWSNARFPAGIVGLFVLGVMAGRLIAERTKPWNRAVVLAVEAALLGCAGLTGLTGSAPIVLMVLAMGMQNAVVHKAGDAKMGLTYVTGALVTHSTCRMPGRAGHGRPSFFSGRGWWQELWAAPSRIEQFVSRAF
jgi:uncharacterized membrane protein YoaK (UPF0700 family)